MRAAADGEDKTANGAAMEGFASVRGSNAAVWTSDLDIGCARIEASGNLGHRPEETREATNTGRYRGPVKWRTRWSLSSDASCDA